MNREASPIYHFERYTLDVRERLLLRDSEAIEIGPKVFDLLVVLVENAGCLLERDELLQRLWGADSYASESNVNQAIWLLRKALDPDGSRLIITVPRKGYRFSCEVLAEAAIATSEQEAQDTMADNADPAAVAIEPGGPSTVPRLRLRLIAAGISLAVALAACLLWWYSGAQGTPHRPDMARRSVVFLGFQNLSGTQDTAWVSTALEHMLSLELSVSGSLRVIPAEAVARTIQELQLQEVDPLSADSLAAVRNILAADLVVLGSYLILEGGAIRVDVRAQDTKNGEPILMSSCTEPLTDLPKLVTTLGARMRHKLGSDQLPVSGSAFLGDAVPSSPEARKLLAQAQAALRIHDVKQAIELLHLSIASDPCCPLTHATLARAWLMIGHHRKAAGEAELAMQLADTLPGQERLVIEALYHKANNQHEQEIKTWSTLVDKYPDDPDLGLALANAQLMARKPQEALLTIEKLRSLALPVGDDPRFDLEEAKVRGLISDLEREEELAARAAARALERGALLLAAEAGVVQAIALFRLGRYDQALQLSRTSANTMAAAGNRVGLIKTKVLQGGILYERGDIAGAKKAQLEALAMAREIGHLRYIAVTLINVANNIEIYHGSIEVAEAYLQEALTASRELDDPILAGNVILSLARVLEEQGKIEAAEQAARGALVSFRELDTTVWLAYAEEHLSGLLCIQGRLSEARLFAEQTLQHSREINSLSDIERGLVAVGVVCCHQGELDRAARCFGELLALSEETGQQTFEISGLIRLSYTSLHQGLLSSSRQQITRALKLLAEQDNPLGRFSAQLMRCDLLLEEGEAGQAVQHAQQMIVELQQLDKKKQLNLAYLVLTRALLQQGKVVEARQAMSKARQCPPPAWDLLNRLRQELISASVLLAENRHQQAYRTVTKVLEKVTHIGHIPMTFEATLVLAETEQALGREKQSCQRLQWLQERATALGFHLIAGKAESLLRQTRIDGG